MTFVMLIYITKSSEIKKKRVKAPILWSGSIRSYSVLDINSRQRALILLDLIVRMDSAIGSGFAAVLS